MKKCKNELKWRVGDAVRTTKLLKFKFGPALASGTEMRVVEVADGGGTIKCTLLNDGFVVYPMMNHQIERIGRVFEVGHFVRTTDFYRVAAHSAEEATLKASEAVASGRKAYYDKRTSGYTTPVEVGEDNR